MFYGDTTFTQIFIKNFLSNSEVPVRYIYIFRIVPTQRYLRHELNKQQIILKSYGNLSLPLQQTNIVKILLD